MSAHELEVEEALILFRTVSDLFPGGVPEDFRGSNFLRCGLCGHRVMVKDSHVNVAKRMFVCCVDCALPNMAEHHKMGTLKYKVLDGDTP